MKDYSELEGKEVRYIDRSFDIDTKGIVIGVDYDIGISVVSKKEKNIYLLCHPSTNTPIGKQILLYKPNAYEYWDGEFFAITNMLLDGVIDIQALDEKLKVLRGNGIVGGASAETCPFGQ